MINVSDNLKIDVINEAMPKQMSVTITNTANLKVLNWYVEENTYILDWELDIAPNSRWSVYNFFKFRVDGAINYDYVNQASTIGVRYEVKIDEVDPNSSENVRFDLVCYKTDGQAVQYSGTNWDISNLSDYTTVYNGAKTTGFDKFDYIGIRNVSSTKNLKCKIHFRRARVYMYINNDNAGTLDYSTIMATEENVNKYIAIGTFDNSNIVGESFEFTESICSEEKLKLGL